MERVLAGKKGAPWIDLSSPLEEEAPLAFVTEALCKAAGKAHMGPLQGDPALRKEIAECEYAGLEISPGEIFLSDGARSDLFHLQELFDAQNTVALPDPSYPFYLESSVIAGRTKPWRKSGGYGGVVYLPSGEAEQFEPKPPRESVDLIYLCSPSNPTGTALSRGTLETWVDFARKKEAVLFFDATYAPFLQSKDAPSSIYAIAGANEVAVEVKSFSKRGGLSHLRCSYTVVPKSLKVKDTGRLHSLHALWERQQALRFRGVPPLLQSGIFALYTPEGRRESAARIASLQGKSQKLLNALRKEGHTVYGGTDAPLLWWKAPEGLSSWDFFLLLLEKAQLVTLPGTRFGMGGEGFVRLSAFAPLEKIEEALERIKKLSL